MIRRLRTRLASDTLEARTARTSLWSGMGFVGSQVIRLASNLVLTRLLAPEAFGAMALVNAVLIGLVMFSDVGLGPAVQRSARGDDPDFLDTLWTVQVLRGFALSGVAVALAWPMAALYHEPELARLLPVAGLALAISGLTTMRLDVALRHLRAREVTILELASQVLGVAATALLAALIGGVWALVLGGVAAAAIHVGLFQFGLPGPRHRWRSEREALVELRGFGAWIFLSTLCSFLVSQGDRLVLGRVLTLDALGIYNIAAFLGAVPLLLSGTIAGRVIIPLYRQSPPWESAENARRAGRIRLRLGAVLLGVTLLLGLIGPWLVSVLYDARYHAAGSIVVMITIVLIPSILVAATDPLLVARGETRAMFLVQVVRAALTLAAVVAGAVWGGLWGVLVGQLAAGVALYPLSSWVTARRGAWLIRYDGALLGLAVVVGTVIWAVHILAS